MNELSIGSLMQAGTWCIVQVTLLSGLALLFLWPLGLLKRPMGSGPALSVIAMAAFLTLLSFAPLPSWWSALERTVTKSSASEILEAQPVSADEPGGETNSESTATTNKKLEASTIDWGKVLADAVTNVDASAVSTPSPWSWRGAVLLTIAVFLGLGVISLLVSLLGLVRLRRTSAPIANQELNELMDVLLAQASCCKAISVRESSLVGGPATFGHFSPVILLPPAWKNWSVSQLSAVLAHEIAHICRGDFLSHLLSQCCLAVHFYHPLMHCLVNRLRLDQELAADALAASWSGPRESYLRALAEVALSLPPRGSGLAVRSFVPSRRDWVRRIEMLKSMKGSAGVRSRGWPVVWVCLIGIIALAVSTVRGPRNLAVAQEPGAAKASASAIVPSSELLTKYVPSNADLVAVVRPGQLLSSPIGKIASAFGDGPSPILAMKKETGLEPEKFDQIVIGMVIGSSPRPVGVIVARYGEADKVQALLPKEKPMGDVGGVALFQIPHDELVWGSIDSKTVIIGSILEVTKALSTSKSSALLGREAWVSVKGSPLAVIVKSEAIRAAAKSDSATGSHTPQAEFQRMLLLAGIAAPFWEETDAVALQLQTDRDIQLTMHAESGTEEQAKEVAATASALATLGKNFLKSLQESNQLKQPVHILLTDAARETLSTMKASSSGNAASVSLLLANQERVAAILPGLVSSARAEAAKANSMNNMKQIAIALHNYHDTHGHMPPAILYGPDGKTPHSWRVAILPYIEQDALYRSYKFDEPWDSETNKKVLAQVPRTYQDPSEQGKSTNTSYFAVAGVNTMLNLGAKGARMADITDGTSNTIMVVDAKKDIPWTKPEDINVDTPAAMLGYQKDSFMAGMGDGSVQAIKKTIDATMLKWLFIRDDGNVVVVP